MTISMILQTHVRLKIFSLEKLTGTDYRYIIMYIHFSSQMSEPVTVRTSTDVYTQIWPNLFNRQLTLTVNPFSYVPVPGLMIWISIGGRKKLEHLRSDNLEILISMHFGSVKLTVLILVDTNRKICLNNNEMAKTKNKPRSKIRIYSFLQIRLRIFDSILPLIEINT